MSFLRFLCLSIFLIIVGCEKFLPPEPSESDVLDGPMEGLSPEQLAIFNRGDEAFGEVFTPATGLGPYYVAASCATCHAGDGKGHPFNNLTRFGKFDTGNAFNQMLNQGGPQLQNRAIVGFVPEVIPSTATGVTELTAPSVTGLGLLEAVSDADLLAMADPNDSNGDGISGRVNWVSPPSFFSPFPFQIPDSSGRYIGRFGKKGAALNLLHQTVGAYKQDMGVTSDFDMEDPINYAVSSQIIDNVPDPEVPASRVQDLVFYLRTLKAPIQRDESNSDVIAGKQLFIDVQCESCHKQSLTSTTTDIATLSNIQFSPYTDLLLHDMGTGLDDGYTEGSASSSEWKTPALWGIGLTKDAQGGNYFLMHDGRARSIEEAILLHGGEAENSKNMYVALTQSEKEQIIQFLESL